MNPGGAHFMRKILVNIGAAAIAMVSAAMPVCAQVELPKPVYQVRMSASYEPNDNRIEGVKRIRWRNTSSVPIDELQFHLYLNAFANDPYVWRRVARNRVFALEGRAPRFLSAHGPGPLW